MKILLYAPNYLPATRYGGPIASSHGLARALVALGHDVHVFTTNVDGPGVLDVPLDQAVLIDGVQVRYFPISTPKRIYHSPAMGRAIDAEIAAFDVVHINGVYLWPGPRLAAAAERRGVPVVISPRGMLVPEMIAGKSALVKRVWIALKERPHLAKAAAIHVTSDEELDGVRRLGLNLAPIVVLGNGVDGPAKPPSPADIERIWSGVVPGQRLAFLGRLDWTKGLDLAIDAARACQYAYLLIAGPDQIGLRRELEPRLKRPDGTSAGRFVGPLDGIDKWAMLAGADVVLVPSLRESFGMTVAEALLMGTPVVCTPGVGAVAIVEEIDARCVAQRTAGDISNTTRTLLEDPSRRAAIGHRARAIMAREHAWSTIAARMTDIYAAVCHAAAPAA